MVEGDLIDFHGFRGWKLEVGSWKGDGPLELGFAMTEYIEAARLGASLKDKIGHQIALGKQILEDLAGVQSPCQSLIGGYLFDRLDIGRDFDQQDSSRGVGTWGRIHERCDNAVAIIWTLDNDNQTQ